MTTYYQPDFCGCVLGVVRCEDIDDDWVNIQSCDDCRGIHGMDDVEAAQLVGNARFYPDDSDTWALLDEALERARDDYGRPAVHKDAWELLRYMADSGWGINMETSHLHYVVTDGAIAMMRHATSESEIAIVKRDDELFFASEGCEVDGWIVKDGVWQEVE
jgi:hypothetical protein